MQKPKLSLLHKVPDLHTWAFLLMAFMAAAFPLIIFKTTEMCYINGRTYADNDLYYGSKALVLNLLAPVMLLMLLLYMRKSRSFFRTNLWLLAYTAWAFVSALASPYRMNSIFGWPFRWQGAVTYFMYFVLFSFVLTFLKKKQIKPLLLWLYAGSTIIAVYGLLQYYGIEPLKGIFFNPFNIDLIDGEVRSTIGNRNFFGSYMALLSLTTLFIYLMTHDKKETRLHYPLSLLFFAGVVASLTRGVWLGCLGAFILMLILFRSRIKEIRVKLVLILISFSVIFLVMSLTGSETPFNRFSGAMEDIRQAQGGDLGKLGSGRLYIYKRTLGVFLQKPLLGTGPDNLAYYAALSPDEGLKYFGNRKTICIDKAHCEYLEYAATTGLPGLLLYLGFISSIIIPAFKNMEMHVPATGLIAGITGYLLQATFNIGVISVLPLFIIYLAIMYNINMPLNIE